MTQNPTQPATPVEVLAATILALLAAVTAPIWVIVELAGLAHTGTWPRPRPTQILRGTAGWPHHLGNPAAGFPGHLGASLPGPVLFYAVAIAVTAALTTICWQTVKAVNRIRGGHRGYAAPEQIRAHLSPTAVRARARHTRPALTGRVRPEQVGLSLGRDIHSGQHLWGSSEDSYLYLGPPRSGKGVHLVIPQTLDAPGAVVVTATRPDTLRHTLKLRQAHGPVVVFDPQHLAGDVPRLRWTPHRGCADPLIAIGRARALAAGSHLAGGSVTHGDYWQAMTEAVLRCYLHAAAISDRSIRDVLAWAARPTDPTPVQLLRTCPDAVPGWAEELAAQAAADPRQRDTVWSGVRRAVDCLADPRVLDACSPPPGEQFDPATFLKESGTLYLLGSTGAQLSVAPLITALIEDLVDTARRHAAAEPGGRLDPPLLLMLDEAANIAPLPSLPNLLADGGGVGITTVAVLQSLAQARSRWGEPAADALWDAATTKVVLGGLAHADDLTKVSRLAGDIDDLTRTRSTGPGGTSSSTSMRRLPALPVEKLRCLPPGHAVVLARHTPPIHAKLTAWWARPDAAAIRDISTP
jgi:type IV secretion system protein VirD4